MKEEQNTINRRNFLKTVGAAGLGSVLVSKGAMAGPNQSNAEKKAQKPKYPQVPRRKLGKTGVKVPCLSLGGNYDLLNNQIILRMASQWGINCWDTANSYTGGNSELGIGKFLSRNPKFREKLFLITKASHAKNVADVERMLQNSLKRMNTKYIDLYLGVHTLSDPGQLTDELKQWAKRAKKQKLIRFFGFSTHSNMPENLTAGAKLDWIDAIMMSCNFRLIQDDKFQAAIDACNKAGIGLITIKALGRGQRGRRGPRSGPSRPGGRRPTGPPEQSLIEADKKLLSHFLQRGFTDAQAKIKAVVQDERISSVCVGMQSTKFLKQDVAAVLDKTTLSQTDMDVLKEYAQITCSDYCAGCSNICNSALPDVPYISDVMRYLMYYNSYGQQVEAKRLFAQIPASVRNKLLGMEYSLAEARCPQHLPISKLVAEAVSKLA